MSSDAIATARWLVDGVDFSVDTAPGLRVPGRFDRVGGSYEPGADGGRLELAVDVASLDAGNGFVGGLLRFPDAGVVRFTSTRIRRSETGALHVEGGVEAAGRFEPIAFDAHVSPVDGGLRLRATATVDRERLGAAAGRFAAFLPATVQITTHFVPNDLVDAVFTPRESFAFL